MKNKPVKVDKRVLLNVILFSIIRISIYYGGLTRNPQGWLGRKPMLGRRA
jgi:hypothetical protein